MLVSLTTTSCYYYFTRGPLTDLFVVDCWLQVMESLIRDLNDPSNQGSPDRIHDLQRQIQKLQKDPSAWQLGLDLLQHEEDVMRFYGALTIGIKVSNDW